MGESETCERVTTKKHNFRSTQTFNNYTNMHQSLKNGFLMSFILQFFKHELFSNVHSFRYQFMIVFYDGRYVMADSGVSYMSVLHVYLSVYI